MRTTISKKKYVTDQLLQLLIVILVALGIYYVSHSKPIIMFIMELLLLCSWMFLLNRIILLPMDLLQGWKEQEVYFSSMCNIDEYEFFGKKCFGEWHFYFGAEDTLTVLVPVCLSHEEILQMDRPVINQKVRIRYYKYSKILCSWEIL